MFSRSTEYAVRALSLLTLEQEKSASLQSKEIAAELGLPPPFLSKVLRRLAASDLLSSQRGRRGGFRLARPAEEISLLSVVEVFEGHISGMECVFGLASCSDKTACVLHCEWEDVKQRLRRLLEKTTLAEVAQRAIATDSSYRSNSNRGFEMKIPGELR